MTDISHKCNCNHCGKELDPSHTGPCPECGKSGKTMKVVVNEKIVIKTGLKIQAEGTKIEKKPKLIILFIVVWIISSIIGSLMSFPIGFVIGLIAGGLVFAFGPVAIIKVKTKETYEKN